MKKYQCQRCKKIFESESFKSDNQASCPFCIGVGKLISKVQPISMVGVDQTIWRRFQAACRLAGTSTKKASEDLWKNYANKILGTEKKS